MQRLLLIIVMTGAALFCGACSREPAVTPSGETVRVGVIGPFSGAEPGKGQDGLTGIKAVLRMTPLLRNGDGIELAVEDDQGDPGLAEKALKKLAADEKVSAVVTLSSSGTVLALARIADTCRIPVLAAYATHPAVIENNDYVSQICFNDRFQGAVAALYVRDELLVDRVAIFSDPDSDYSTHLAEEFRRKFTDIGGRVTARIAIGDDSQDLTQVLRTLRNDKTELLYLPIKALRVISLIEQSQRIGWRPQFMGSDGLGSTVFLQYPEAIPLLDGLLVTDFFHHDMPLSRFGKRIEPHVKGRITTFGALAIEGFAILMNAINKCEPTSDRQCINQNVQSTANFTGIMGNISIDANGKASRPLVVNTIEKGRFHFLVKVY